MQINTGLHITHFRLVADVTMKVVAMLNQYTTEGTVFHEKPNSFSEGCMSCHEPQKEIGNADVNMSCDLCHDDPHMGKAEHIKSKGK